MKNIDFKQQKKPDSTTKVVAVGSIKKGKVTINCSKEFLKAQK